MESPPRPEQKQMRHPEDVDDDHPDPTDVDSEEDRRWQEWIDDESGVVPVPLPPLPEQPEVGIHAPTPEMDGEDKPNQQEYERGRREQED